MVDFPTFYKPDRSSRVEKALKDRLLQWISDGFPEERRFDLSRAIGDYLAKAWYRVKQMTFHCMLRGDGFAGKPEAYLTVIRIPRASDTFFVEDFFDSIMSWIDGLLVRHLAGPLM